MFSTCYKYSQAIPLISTCFKPFSLIFNNLWPFSTICMPFQLSTISKPYHTFLTHHHSFPPVFTYFHPFSLILNFLYSIFNVFSCIFNQLHMYSMKPPTSTHSWTFSTPFTQKTAHFRPFGNFGSLDTQFYPTAHVLQLSTTISNTSSSTVSLLH